MTSRERVFTALAHKQPDRCPVDYWGTPETNRKMMEYFSVDTMDELLDRLEVDVQTVYPRMLHTPKKKADGTSKHTDLKYTNGPDTIRPDRRTEGAAQRNAQLKTKIIGSLTCRQASFSFVRNT